MEKLSKRLKELRQEKGLSQSQLAKEIQVNQTTIGKWEACKRSITVEYIIALCNYFNVSADYLIGLVD